MYNALVVPYFDYCSPVGGCIGKCQSERLQKLQNRAARIITNSDYMTPSSCLLHDLGWDTLEKRRTKQLAITMYNVVNEHFPLRLHELFQTTSQVHTYNLRKSAHSLRPENVVCTIEVLHFGTASQPLAKPRPLLLASESLC